MEHERTQESRDKTWEQQKNPRSHGGRIDAREDDLIGPCGSAAGPPQNQEPGKRNQGKKDHRPREPDQADDDKEGHDLRHRQQNEPAGDRLHHAHRQPVARESSTAACCGTPLPGMLYLNNIVPRQLMRAGLPGCPPIGTNHDESGKRQGSHILLAAAP
jgi:hypothetical protein